MKITDSGSNKKLERAMKKYLSHSGDQRFWKLIKLLNQEKKCSIYLEQLCTSLNVKNLFHLGMFYQQSERLLEAAFFIEKHMENNEADIPVLLQLQYVYVKLGDFNSSKKTLLKLSRLEVDEVQHLRAILMHLIAFGATEDIVKVSKDLGKHQSLDEFTLKILYEALVTTADSRIITVLKKYREGRGLLLSASERDIGIIKRGVLLKLSTILRATGGELNA